MTPDATTPAYLKVSPTAPKRTREGHIIGRSMSGNAELHIDTSQFQNLGQGNYGAVASSSGYLSPRRETKTGVAIKFGRRINALKSEFEAAKLLREKGLHESPFLCSPIGMLPQEHNQPAMISLYNVIDYQKLMSDPKFSYLRENPDHLKNINRMILHDIYKGALQMLDKNMHHNDTKADNIMLGSDGYFKYIDFGIATQKKADDVTLKDYHNFLTRGEGYFDSEGMAKQALTYEMDHLKYANPISIMLHAAKHCDPALYDACKNLYEKEKKLATFHALNKRNGILPIEASSYAIQTSREYTYYLLNDQLPAQMKKMAEEIKSDFIKLQDQFPNLKVCSVTDNQRKSYAQYIEEVKKRADGE